MANPQAVGAIYPIAGYVPDEQSNNVVDILARMEANIAKIAERLAPEPLMLPITFQNVPAGIVVATILLPTSGFNGVLMALTSGLVDLYFGSSSTGAIPDMQLTGGANPIYIPLPPQTERQVVAKVDAASPANANGILYLLQY
jgi:hypothetical protein